MPLAAGYTTYRGVITLSLIADKLRVMTKRIRRQIRSNRLDEAQATFNEMIAVAGTNQELVRAIDDMTCAELGTVQDHEQANAGAARDEHLTVNWLREGF